MSRLAGFGFTQFRSFADQPQLISPLVKVNLFAGPNNSGKSNILRFAQRTLGLVNGRPAGLDIAVPAGLDVPLRSSGGAPRLWLAQELETVLERAASVSGLSVGHTEIEALRQILETRAVALANDEFTWIEYNFELTNPGSAIVTFSRSQLVAALEETAPDVSARLGALCNRLTSSYSSSAIDNLLEVMRRTADMLPLVPPVQTIEAIRSIDNTSDDFAGYSGRGLVSGLARLQDPPASRQTDRLRFDAINRFVRTVLDDPTASLRIPFERDTVNVDRQGLLLPLDNLGTGVHEVVILAAAATLHEDHLICIEEPEIHLHPLLQRKLIRYLETETKNDYLIATHSASLLDSSFAAVFHVSATGDGTSVRRASTPAELATICLDLGYRASDLVQSNCVIWVEGPSDRIYLRTWLGQEDPSLIEGIHYSIMFYGGRLLNHLSPDDPDVEDFISLRRLNRHIAILIDSDRSSKHAHLSPTKRRVRKGFEEGSGFAWVTDGYTIENYVPHDLLKLAVETVHPGATLARAPQGSNPLSTKHVRRGPKVLDKVAIAREAASGWSAATPISRELRAHVRQTVSFVRGANSP